MHILSGNSGSQLSYISTAHGPAIAKTGRKLHLDYQVLNELRSNGFSIPAYYSVADSYVTMQFIPGLTICQFLESRNDVELLVNFFSQFVTVAESNSQQRNVAADVAKKCSELSCMPRSILNRLPFTFEEISSNIPDELPCGLYHGDFSLENIIFSDGRFYLIDANYNALNSYAFDVAKLMQDTASQWFSRHCTLSALAQEKLQYLSKKVASMSVYSENKYLRAFMFSRILPYCTNTQDTDLVVESLKDLWT